MMPTVQFKCPFCGKIVRAGPFRVEGALKHGVVHEAPACETFRKDESPTDFLARCRAIGITPLAN